MKATKTKRNSGVNAMLDEALALAADPRVVKSESGKVVANFLLRLVEMLATGAPRTVLPPRHYHPEDEGGTNHLRPPVLSVADTLDPIGALRRALHAAALKRGRRNYHALVDHLDPALVLAAQRHFGATANARGQLRGSTRGFIESVTGSPDGVIITLEEAA
jgi:hypothetical protein